MALIVLISYRRSDDNSVHIGTFRRIQDTNINFCIYFRRYKNFYLYRFRKFYVSFCKHFNRSNRKLRFSQLKKCDLNIDTFRLRAFSSQSWIPSVSSSFFLGTSPGPLTGLTNGHPASALRLYSSPSLSSFLSPRCSRNATSPSFSFRNIGDINRFESVLVR